jgi:drug/metabolite transporter (DMT)-like permease
MGDQERQADIVDPGIGAPLINARPLLFAAIAAALFGASTPASKVLLSGLSPLHLAGLLYLGAALGIAPAAIRGGGLRFPGRTRRRTQARLLGIVVAGGICGPVLLLLGLQLAPASSVSLWLSFELAATAVLGVLFFRDHLGLLGWAGVGCALAGTILLSLPSGTSGLKAGTFVLLACLCWGLDNQLSALIDDMTPAQVTFWKGLVAGITNLLVGFIVSPLATGLVVTLAALLVGAVGFGASIALCISSARAIGATRAQAIFASAPFFGAVLSVPLLGESLTAAALTSALLFILGVVLLSLERHAHAHDHAEVEHDHAHRHDDGHHNHSHPDLPPSTSHTHPHRHEALAHAHPHRPELHHRHTHGPRP